MIPRKALLYFSSFSTYSRRFSIHFSKCSKRFLSGCSLSALVFPIKTKRVIHFSFKKYTSSVMASTADDVYNYWFNESISLKEKFNIWFGGGAEQDNYIKEQFGTLIQKARNGELSAWEDLSEGPKHALAFIILIDQFCRNSFRGTPNMFSHDHKSLAVALKLIDTGAHKEFPFTQRLFVYLPLEHHEDLETQEKCVTLFTELYEEAKSSEFANVVENMLKYALLHQEVIKKYGRFPKRNGVLGRENTPEEVEALNNWTYGF